MTPFLLARQSSLVHYLTSAPAIFNYASEALDPTLAGIDPTRLALEARFSFEKRLHKIAGVFPRCFRHLGDSHDKLIREFVEACPQIAIGRLENARQFYEFLSVRWRRSPPTPPYLPDLAACEFAFASVGCAKDDASAESSDSHCVVQPQVRRAPEVALWRGGHDIRPLFERDLADAYVVERDVALAVVVRTADDCPYMIELDIATFDLLASLDDWADLAAFETSDDAAELLTELAAAKLVEIRR